MGKYIVKRLIGLIPVVIGVSICAFLLIHLIPGDPARAILGERATEETMNALREQLGLNDPLYVQYARFMGNVLQGDFGRSVITNNPVIEEFAQRFPATLELSLAAMIIAVIVGVLAGVISAVKQYSIFDNLSMVGALLGVSLPIFWLGLMMQWLFAFKLGLLDASARLSVDTHLQTITNLYLLDAILTGNWPAFVDAFKHILMPSLALATIPMAIIARMTRSSMLEVLKQDYIRTARAKGLKEKVVIFKHALKNAFLPVLTVMGLQFGSLLGGAVLTETIFSWPGVGRLMYEAIMQRDFPVVQNGILIIALIFVLINLLVDILYSYVDPRIRTH
ncbi:binding-protein-dependent transport system inner membrane protein [Thermincola ferriacetica]|uniref:Binding-protein-dependent transport system inner membrane protein n=1 Tax=Thermincola ferriacetica TaxID=281456 RepID=A0A0L6W0X4_9FIRM|nr:ABC transporter permease [Thermincola ferriacetica]KNZ69033.1 binding-protein-dependent transport system inner membrane protein [Thermincola ferriacetica]